MTNIEYHLILMAHGRRVANRAVLSDTPLNARQLSDFHDCYGPQDALPKSERSRTSLIHTFDPSGQHLHYPGGAFYLHEWPAPEGEHSAITHEISDTEEATRAAMLRAAIAQAGRQVAKQVQHIEGDEEQTRGAANLIAQHCAAIAKEFNATNDEALFTQVVEAANATLIEERG